MMSHAPASNSTAARRGAPWTLWAGAGLIAACAALLYVDVMRRGGAIVPYDALRDELPEPMGALEQLARWVGINMTALCWLGYLLAFDGLLAWRARRRGEGALASLRARPNRFVFIWLTSIPIWCAFDAINFYMLDAWRYHGLPPVFAQRLAGYFIAFAAILPGMFLAAQFFQSLGMHKLRVASAERARRVAWIGLLGATGVIVAATLTALALFVPTEMGQTLGVLASALLLAGPGLVVAVRVRCVRLTAFAIGLSWVIWTLTVHDPIGNMALWVGVWLMLDPINEKLGGPSLIGDWLNGRFGRTLALFAGGLLCGLLWELWNYWAIAKWTYDLPFLGPFEQVRYFEMPLLGMVGFLPFAAQCWVMINTIVLLLERCGWRIAEPLADEDGVM